MARTRIPTPYGPVFLHLYHNSKDQKEHLALVVDGNQIDEGVLPFTVARIMITDSFCSRNQCTLYQVKNFGLSMGSK